MCRGTEHGLEEDECGYIYPLVYASHKGLSSAAGNFLYHKSVHINSFVLSCCELILKVIFLWCQAKTNDCQ